MSGQVGAEAVHDDGLLTHPSTRWWTWIHVVQAELVERMLSQNHVETTPCDSMTKSINYNLFAIKGSRKLAE